MTYELYMASLIISTVVSIGLTVYLWRRRPAPGALPVALTMMAVFLCSFGYIIELRADSLTGKLMATNIQYLGIVTIPLTWFIFAVQYSGCDKWLTRRNLFLLGAMPFVTLLLTWTNPLHSLMWYNASLNTSGPIIVIAKTYGVWFWLHTAYSYVLVFLGTVIIIRGLFRLPRLYFEQIGVLLIGAIVPWIWNILYVFRLMPLPRVDLTPSTFTVSGLAVAWSLYRYRLLDVRPVARDTVIENMKDGIIVLDERKRFIDLNLAAQKILGVSASKAIGQTADRLLSGQPELAKQFINLAETDSEYVHGTGDQQQYYSVSISELHNQRHHLTGYLIVLHDLTEIKRMEFQKKELEQKVYIAGRMASVGDLASGIAHEINNPLASVIGYADWLLQKDIPAEIKEDLETINKAAKRVAGILDRLLAFASQREHGREYIDVRPVIEATLELRRFSLMTNHIEVVTQYAPDLPKTVASAGQLQQVFLNLIINAETAMKEAHSGGKLVIKAERRDNLIRISVADNGSGIPAENLNKLFTPFFTTKEPGKGTGLGLSVCYGIINEHGGRIYAESKPGQGATFIIELPVTRMSKAETVL